MRLWFSPEECTALEARNALAVAVDFARSEALGRELLAELAAMELAEAA